MERTMKMTVHEKILQLQEPKKEWIANNRIGFGDRSVVHLHFSLGSSAPVG